MCLHRPTISVSFSPTELCIGKARHVSPVPLIDASGTTEPCPGCYVPIEPDSVEAIDAAHYAAHLLVDEHIAPRPFGIGTGLWISGGAPFSAERQVRGGR